MLMEYSSIQITFLPASRESLLLSSLRPHHLHIVARLLAGMPRLSLSRVAFSMKQGPYRADSQAVVLFRKLLADFGKSHVGLCLNPTESPLGMLLRTVAVANSTPRLGLKSIVFQLLEPPARRRRNRDAKLLCCGGY